MAKINIGIIPDSHVKPGISVERFKWAARWFAEKQCDVIVELGDLADMESLSSYDIGKKSFEGRSYQADVRAANSAREEFDNSIKAINKGRKSRHKALFTPQKIALGGNHDEGRISRVLEDDRKLIGTIGIDDFNYKQLGWRYIPYREYVEIAGFTFCHYFTSGVMGRPISGETPALSIIRKQFTSCVAGHLHLWDISSRTRPDGSRIWGLVAGCFLAEDQHEDYAHQANKLWWKGLTVLKGCEAGDFESLETIGVKNLREQYA